MSVSALCILDNTGSAICARDYRGDVPLGALDAFYPVMSELEETSKATPIFQHEGVTYVWMQHADIFLVALCQSNANAASTMSFLHKLLEVFKFYFKTVVEESIRDNFVTVYELLDEVMDFGYPQFTEGPILREYIKTEAHKLEDFVGKLFGSSDVKNPRELPPQVTGVGATWRKEGIFYQRNEVNSHPCITTMLDLGSDVEFDVQNATRNLALFWMQVFLDCIEQFNVMVNSKGVIVHSELKGTLQMKAYLSGMPECKLGLNDKTMFSRQVCSRICSLGFCMLWPLQSLLYGLYPSPERTPQRCRLAARSCWNATDFGRP